MGEGAPLEEAPDRAFADDLVIYFDFDKNEFAVSTEKARTLQNPATVTKNDFDVPNGSPDFRALTNDELAALDSQIPALKFYYDGDFYLGL